MMVKHIDIHQQSYSTLGPVSTWMGDSAGR